MSSKNILQEFCQKYRVPLPVYDAQRIGGTDHVPQFKCTVTINGRSYAATGSTKINAEKNAAQRVIDAHKYDPRSILARAEDPEIGNPKAPSQGTGQSATPLTQINDPAIISFQRASSIPAAAPDISSFVEPFGRESKNPKYATIRDIPIEHFEIVYLIDGDNCNVTNEDLFANEKALFIYFIAKNNTKPFPFAHQSRYRNCCVFIADTVARDAVDHMISFFLGQMTILWDPNARPHLNASPSRRPNGHPSRIPNGRPNGHHSARLCARTIQYFIVTRDHFGECLEKFAPNCRLACLI